MNTNTNNINSLNSLNGLLNAGDVIDGYVINKKINTSSGEAELYLCEKDSKRYVLKYYYDRTIFSDLEGKLKSLNHQNVLKVFAAGKNKGYYYEIDEYCQGDNLANANLPLSESKAFEVLKQINEGLHAIHSAGIIHRDIKAENIFYRDASRNSIVIGDYGIAIVYDMKNDVNSVFAEKDNIPGTPGYIAPEAYYGTTDEPVITPAVDYYSLGITFWRLVTGKRPFYENGQPLNSEKIQYDTIHGNVRDYLLSLSPDISEKAKTVISGLLVHTHAQRWGYNQIVDFLAGKDVPVFEERKDLSAFTFFGQPLYSLKAIAEAMLKNREKAMELLEGNELIIYLAENISDALETILSQKIEEIKKIKEKYFSLQTVEESEKEEAVIIAAFALESSLTFYVEYNNNSYGINVTSDFKELLLKQPKAILPYLKNEKLGLYYKLDAIALENKQQSISSKIKAVVDKTGNDSTLPYVIYYTITGNTITPFKDKLNKNIELKTQSDYLDLPDNLKERLMLSIDSKDRLVSAWFESVFAVNMNDWYEPLENEPESTIAGKRRNKLLAYGKVKFFNLFLKGKVQNPYEESNSTVEDNKAKRKNLDEWKLETGYTNTCRYSYDGDFSVKKIFSRVTADSGLTYFCSEINHPNEIAIMNDSGEFCFYTWENLKKGEAPLDRFTNIQNINADGNEYGLVPEHLYFWASKNNQVYLIDKNAKVISTLPYSDFEYVGNGYFIANNPGDNLKALVNYRNKIIKTSIDDFISTGSIAAIKKGNGAWKLIKLPESSDSEKIEPIGDTSYEFVSNRGSVLCAFNTEKDKSVKKIMFFFEKDNIVNTTTLTVSGNGGVVTDSNGLTKQLDAVNHKALCDLSSRISGRKILGFDGMSFVVYDFRTMSFKKLLSCAPYDIDYHRLMDAVDSKKLIKLVKAYISKDDYKSANQLIDFSYYAYFWKKKFEETRSLLSLIRKDKMQGLHAPFLVYLEYLAKTYLQENKEIQESKNIKPEDYAKQNINYIKALYLYLCIAGKDIDSSGKIVTDPDSDVIKLEQRIRNKNSLSFANLCAEIIGCKKKPFLPYGWKNEELKDIANELLTEFEKDLEKEISGNQFTFTVGNKFNEIGQAYYALGELKEAISIFEKASKFDTNGSYYNSVDYLRVLYEDSQLEKAMGVYRTFKAMIKDKAELKVFEQTVEENAPAFLNYYKQHMNEYSGTRGSKHYGN